MVKIWVLPAISAFHLDRICPSEEIKEEIMLILFEILFKKIELRNVD
jgi:hypothetical protein